MTFGQRLRELRGKRTLRETAEACGLSLSYLSDLERGRTVPSIEVLVKLANLYAMPVVALIQPVAWDGEYYHHVAAYRKAVQP